MSELITDFQQFFIANEITDVIFLDGFLDNPNTAYCIYEYGGKTPEPQIAGAQRKIQIVTRDLIPATAKEMANKAYQLLSTEDGKIELTLDRWGMIALTHPPYKLKVDSQNRTYYFFNLNIITYTD